MAQVFFVGNGTNWSSTSSWATSSGGASGAAIPANGDDVIFDSNSPGNLTIDTTTNTIRSIVMTGYTHTVTHAAAVTLNIGGASAPVGNIALVFTGTYTIGDAVTSAISIADTSAATNTYNFNGATLGNVTINNSTTTTMQLVTNGFTTGATATVTLTQGGLNTNGQTCSWGIFSSSNSNTRAITLGASSITLTGTSPSTWNTGTSTGLTLNSGTSVITLSGAAAGFSISAGTFNSFNLIGSGAMGVSGAGATITTLTRIGTAVKTDSMTFNGNSPTISTLSLTSNSTVNRLLVRSAAVGIARTVTATTLVCSGTIDFQDITGAGAATWTTAASGATYFGDCGGNSGITMTAAATQTWSGNTTGNWSTTANWTSRAPLPQDNVTINALTSGTITIDMPRAGASISLLGTTGGTVTVASGTNPVTHYGSLTLVSAVTWTTSNGTWTMAGRGSYMLTSAGKSFGNGLTINAPTGTYTPVDAITVPSNKTLSVNANTTLDASVNNPSVTTGSCGGGGTLKMGSSTWTLNATGIVWSAGFTVVAGTSTIVIADTSSTGKNFNGGQTYNNLSITGGGTGSVTITGANTFNTLSCAGPKSLIFPASTTQTIAKWGIGGTSGNLVTITSSTPGTQYTISIASGTVSTDYLSLTDSNATGGASFYAGTHSTNVSNNTNWNFSYPANIKTISPAGGNYSATTAWVEGAVPIATDAVQALGAASGSLTIDTSAATCLTFDMTGYANTLTHTAAVTFTVTGSTFTLVLGMTYTLGSATTSALAFTAASGTVTITSGGKTLGNVTTASGITNSAATYTLGDASTLGATATWTHTSGTFNTNNQTCSWGLFNSANSNTRSLILGSSSITILAGGVSWGCSFAIGMLVPTSTSTITFTAVNVSCQFGNQTAANVSYNNLVFTGGGSMSIGSTGVVNCANLTVTGTATKTCQLTSTGVVATGTITLNANSSVNRLLILSQTVGTQATLTAASLVCTNVIDFQDIKGAGAATWTTGASGATFFGDCGGNSGITMTAAATQTWSGNTTGNWSTTANWTSRVPLPQDNVAVSGLTSGTVTMDMPRSGATVDFTGSSGGAATVTANPTSIFGSLTLVAAITWTSTSSVVTLAGRSSYTLTNAGHSFGDGLTIAGGGTYTSADNISIPSSKTFTINGLSTFDNTVNNVAVTTGTLLSAITTGTVKFGNSTWTISGTGTCVNIGSTTTITAGSSTILLSDTSSTAKTFAGSGKTYNNLQITGGGTGSVIITGANTFNSFVIGAPKTVTFPSSTVTTVTRLVAIGTSGNLVTFNASTPGTAATLTKTGGGQVSMNYVSMQDITGSPASTWYAGPLTNSTNVSNNTNVTFTFATAVATISPAGGNYSATTAWMEGNVPTASFAVVAYAGSGALTVDTSAATCLTFDMSFYTNTLTHTAAVTLTIAGGTFTLVSGMTYTLGSATTSALAFTAASGTVTITTGGKTLGNVTTASGVTNSAATYTLGDSNTLGATATWTHTSGTFTTNNQTCSWGKFVSSNSNTRTLTLGSSSVTITFVNGTGAWSTQAAGLTVTSNTATVTFSGNVNPGLQSGATNWNGLSIVFNAAGTANIAGGGATFANVTRSGTATKTDVFNIISGFTVTGTLTLTSNSSVNRILVLSSAVGTAQTITAATLVCSNVIDFQDITGAGAATWTTAASGATFFGDCQGNSGITFTTPATQTWSGNTTGNWSTAANWTSRVPLPQDNVAISGLTSNTITADMPRLGANIDFTGSTGGHWVIQLAATSFGSWTLISALSLTSTTYTFAGRGAQTLTQAGVAWTVGNITIAAPGGTYTLQGDWNIPTFFTLSNGTFDTNGHNFGSGAYTASIGTTTYLRTGTFTVTCSQSGVGWSMIGTVVCGMSTIVLTGQSPSISSRPFGGGGQTYNNLTINGGTASTTTITGANTFNTLTVGNGVLLTMPASTTNTFSNFNVSGANYGYQYLPGVAANYVSTPNATPLQITGNLTVDVKLALATWTPAVGANVLGKWNSSSGGVSWQLNVSPSGVLTLTLSVAGAAGTNFNSTVATGFVAGSTNWIRASFTTSSMIQFFTSSDGVTWTQLGTNVSAAAITSLFNTTADVEIGTQNGGANAGSAFSVYEARVYNSALGSGSGTAVFDANFATKAFGANSFTESSSNAATVTINGTTAQVGDGRVAIVSSTPGTQATLSNPSGVVSCNYLSLQDSKATGGALWYAGPNSINVSNNTGWIFTSAQSQTGNFLPFFR